MKILKVMEIVIEMLFPQRCPCCDELLDEEDDSEQISEEDSEDED